MLKVELLGAAKKRGFVYLCQCAWLQMARCDGRVGMRLDLHGDEAA